MILSPFLLALLPQQPHAPAVVTRPRDPFVFRCVLDERPRAIVVALHDDLWVAYDAQRCALYKAWKGGVKLDGPVYTAVHGPQPTTLGHEYTTAVTGDAWSAFQDGKQVACKVRYGGYRISANRVVLEWRVQIANGPEVVVHEVPEFVQPKMLFDAHALDDLVLGDGTQAGLRRSFEAKDLPANVQINLTVRTDGAAGKFGFLERERFEDVIDAKGNVIATRMYAQVPLIAARPRNELLLFFTPPRPGPKPLVPPSSDPTDKR